MTILGLPAGSFFAYLSWPFFYIIMSFVVYHIMKKQDAQVDDTEFSQSQTGRNASSAKKEGGADA